MKNLVKSFLITATVFCLLAGFVVGLKYFPLLVLGVSGFAGSWMVIYNGFED